MYNYKNQKEVLFMENMIDRLEEMCVHSHVAMVAAGFWPDKESPISKFIESCGEFSEESKLLKSSFLKQRVLLISSEIGETLDALRKNRLGMFNKDTFEDELADITLRLFDHLGFYIMNFPVFLDEIITIEERRLLSDESVVKEDEDRFLENVSGLQAIMRLLGDGNLVHKDILSSAAKTLQSEEVKSLTDIFISARLQDIDLLVSTSIQKIEDKAEGRNGKSGYLSAARNLLEALFETLRLSNFCEVKLEDQIKWKHTLNKGRFKERPKSF